MLKGTWAILKDAPSILEEMFGGLFIWPFKAMGSLFGWAGGRIETWGFARFIKAVEPVAILIAIFAFTIEMSDRREERTARAWQLVTTKASGNSGKIQALEYLHSQSSEWLLSWWPYVKERTVLEGIDLTPPALAEQWKGKAESERSISWRKCPDRTYLLAVKLPDARMSNAKLPCALLVVADLSSAYLTKANLTGADLTHANLSGADLSGADLTHANLSEANLSGAKLDGANLSGADLTHANLSGANFSETNLFGDNFNKANLRRASLSGADLSEAYLRGVNLSEATLTKANLSGANLRGADLGRAMLWQADLTEANLIWADLSGAKLMRANLSGANLREANLREADLSGANFENATGAPDLSDSCAEPDNPPLHLPDDAKRPTVWKPCPPRE